MQGMRQLLNRVRARYEGRSVPSPSPRAQATREIFADRGSDEGTVDFEHRVNARARFENPRPIEQSMEESGLSPRTRDRAPHTERYERQMAESRARAASKSPRARTSGPPTQVLQSTLFFTSLVPLSIHPKASSQATTSPTTVTTQ